eukprot:gene20657-31831_t
MPRSPGSTSWQVDRDSSVVDMPAGEPLGFFFSVVLVLKKNLVLKLRSVPQLLLEVFLPTFFVTCLIPAWAAVGKKTSDAECFWKDPVRYDLTFESYLCRRSHVPSSSPGEDLIQGYKACGVAWPEHNCIGNLCIEVPSTPQLAIIQAFRPLMDPLAGTLPDYDTVALARKFAETVELPGTTELGRGVINSLGTGHRVIVVPSSASSSTAVALAAELEEFLTERTYTHRYVSASANFTSEQAATDFTTSGAGSSRVWAVVVVNGDNDYVLRMNRTAVPRTRDTFSQSMGLDSTFEMYLTGGFATMQGMVNWFFTRSEVNLLSSTTVYPMPIASYEQDEFVMSAGDFLPIVFTLAFLFPVAQMVAAVVREKELRIREGMLIMGLTSGAFKFSWVLTLFLQMSVSALAVAGLIAGTWLSNTAFTVVFFLFWFFCMSVAAFSILISVFFSKASTAVILAPMLFLLVSIPGFVLDKDSTSAGSKSLASLSSSFAFAEGVYMVCQASGAGSPMTWSRAGRGDYSFNSVLFFLVFDTCLYLLLAAYFDAVIPGEWGASRPFYFLCDPRYYCGGRKASYHVLDGLRVHDTSKREAVTDPSLQAKERITLKQIRKEFPAGGRVNVANDDVTLSLYEGQICALLGHNGAGKTTLINMLTGMLPLTSGDAVVYGNSIVSEMAKVRRSIGLCPQHNILWENLTCAEHLAFYAGLKGVPSKQIQEKVADMLDRVGLADKKDVYARSLSGGMKRKLSVGISLVGGSKFVILDEPTAGMDVQARRAVWDLLKAVRPGRTILLTTHFMDEADLLGDSIAILHGGKVFCHGSSFFLKQILGVGYNLKMELASDAKKRDIPAVHAFVNEKLRPSEDDSPSAASVGQAELLSAAGSELSFRVPTAAVPKFGSLFEALEVSGESLGVLNFGVSVTTLEEIFLKIAHDQTPPVPLLANAAAAGSSPVVRTTPDNDDAGETAGVGDPLNDNLKLVNLDAACRLQGGALSTSQWKGLLYKRMRYAARDKKTVCFQLIMPVVLVFFTLLLASITVGSPPALDLAGYDYYSQFPVAPEGSPWTAYLPVSDILDVLTVPTSQLPAGSSGNSTGAERMSAYLLETAKTRGNDDDRWQAIVQDAVDTFSGGTASAAMRNLSALPASIALFHNSTSFHTIPQAIHHLSTARLRYTTGDASAVLKTVNHPLPYSQFFKDKLEGWTAITTGVLLIIPFGFIPANYVAFLVQERECKAKQVQIVSGVQLWAYWASNFVWDFASFCGSLFLAIVMYLIFDRDEYVGSAETFFAVLTLYLLYACGAISSSYLASFHFEKPTTAQNVTMAFNFMTGFILVFVVFILDVFESTRSAAAALRFVFRLTPCYCLGDGMVALAQLPSRTTMGITNENAWSLDVAGWDMIFLAIFFPFYFVAAMGHDFPQILFMLHLRKSASLVDDGEGASNEDEDADVAAERQEVLRGREGDVVTVRRLRKVFPASGGNPKPKVAVRDLAFGVKQGEIFAFLGTNGAGKTTTISVLAGDYEPTSGSASIKGFDVVSQSAAAKRELGYCPQFDALLDLLTPREHMDVYCALRGVPVDLRGKVSEALIAVLDLHGHADTICKSLSGGNRRKTSVAISLIGGPSCLLLDEPTAGIDPVGRRGMWRALQSLSGGRSVILTTHHLEEVEALAHRTAIMVNGGLECLGTLSHLKAKFGGAYEIQVKTEPDKEQAVREYFNQNELLSGASLVEATNHRLTYKVPGGCKLSALFSTVHEAKGAAGIVDYSISQTSLEQVFITICRKYDDQHAAPSPTP